MGGIAGPCVQGRRRCHIVHRANVVPGKMLYRCTFMDCLKPSGILHGEYSINLLKYLNETVTSKKQIIKFLSIWIKN